MTDAYIGLEDETDPDAIAQDAFDYIASKVPGFEAAPAAPMTVLVETQAAEQSVERSLASRTADSIFRFFGELVAVPPLDATRATVGSTWTLSDDDGHTIAAGTLIGLRDAAGELVAFRVASDVTVAALATQTAAGEVILEAVNAGAAGSGLSGAVELIDALAFVASIALTGVTTGGVDAELDSDYLDRLAARLRLQAPRPIIPTDFEVLARDVAGVERAVALDGYNPADQTSGNERMVAVAIVDEAGEALPSGVKDDVDELLQAQREATFVVNVIDPAYTTVDVTATAVAHAGFGLAAVDTAVEAALADFLSPANWGQPPFGEERAWVHTSVVRIWEVLEAVQRVEGVNYVTALTVEGGTVDVNLTGAAPLTRAGVISITVTAP